MEEVRKVRVQRDSYCWKCPHCGFKIFMASSTRRVCPHCHSSVDKYGTVRTKAEMKETSGTYE